MANLSQLRRQRMLAFLEKMREQHKDDDEVLVAINEVENEINEKKYGLVWEEHSEEVEERMVDEVPIFVEDKDKEITMTDNGYNFLLEGDNLHSLHLLEKTHKEKIDVIYIDPPYNTGSDDFRYDDNYIDSNDSFRHSKWLSFMAARLSIARRLLKDTGVVWISIDENELFNLKELCDSIFGDNNFRSIVTVMANPGGRDYGGIAKTTEYLLVYSKTPDAMIAKIPDSDHVFTDKDEYGAFEVRELRNRNIKFNDQNRPNLCYPFYVDGDSEDEHGLYSVSLEPDEKHTIEVMPLKSRGIQTVWRWGKEQKSRANLNINVKAKKKRDGSFMIVEKYRDELVMMKNTWLEKKYRTENGTLQLKEIFEDQPFGYPKPVDIPRKLISSSPRKDSVVLDFFAGTGTTGQAVLELNKEDGGNRHFILCTNNENNICDDVTYPRLQTVITGTRSNGSKYSDGIPADLKYYRTDFIPKKSESLATDLITHIDEMIQLEYGVKIDKEKYISILTDEDADELEKNWANYPNIRAIYISRQVLLTGKQKELFGTHDCFTIPDYYFREELREAGEA